MPDDVRPITDQHAPKPGDARCPGVLWDDLLKADTRAVPDFMTRESYEFMGSAPLATSRYTSADFFQLENEKMWPHVWQFAAREEDIPEPGDYVLYENVGPILPGRSSAGWLGQGDA